MTRRDSDRHLHREKRNAMGQVIRIEEGVGSKLSETIYAYDDVGRKRHITDSKNHTITMNYDVRDNRTYLLDPDLGRIDSQYDSYGALAWQRDAKSQVTQYSYDKLGRETKRSDASTVETRKYDKRPNGKGKLASVDYGHKGKRAHHRSTPSYDALSRLSSNKECIAAPGSRRCVSYTTRYKYDDYSRLKVTTLPGGKQVAREYKNNILNALRRGEGGSRIWQVNELDARGRPYAERAGNGVYTRYEYNFKDRQGGMMFDKPDYIRKGSALIRFDYGAGHQRLTRKQGNFNTWYLQGGPDVRIERLTHNRNKEVTTKYHYLVDGRVVSIDEENSTGTVSRYLHSDRMGSASVLTDAAGHVVERMSYDIWGQVRSLTAGSESTVLKSGYHTKSYTGHEALADVDLVHMNGRIYDPVLGRFMSADPFVQYRYNTQSYNRYSYVLNNPLGATDPSGYMGESVSGEISVGDDGEINITWESAESQLSGDGEGEARNEIGSGNEPRVSGDTSSQYGDDPVLGAAKPDDSDPFGDAGGPSRRLQEGAGRLGRLFGDGADVADQHMMSGGGAFGIGSIGVALGAYAAKLGFKNLARRLGSVSNNALRQFGRSIDDLSAATSQPINHTGLTTAARALDKHASGQRPTGTFPKLSGNVANRNKQAQEIVDGILNNSESQFKQLGRGGLEVRAPSGQGLRFEKDGTFSGFVD